MRTKFFPLLFTCFILAPTFARVDDKIPQAPYSPGASGIRGHIFDAETKEPLPARVVLTNGDGKSFGSYYKNYPGHFTPEDGSFAIEAPAGIYQLEVFHGIDYVSQRQEIEIKQGAVLNLDVSLKPWVPLRKMGWVNGEGHAHLYTDEKENVAMLKTVRQICRAQGVDFIATNQGWAGYDDDDWRAGYAKFSDENFLLYYGAEMPKYRDGHTWWLGLESTRGFFSAAMDSCYENFYYKVEELPHWDFANLPFPNIPAVYLVPRFKETQDAVACIPHPTSWWWEKRGSAEKYTTNACEYLSYSLLAGPLWDGLVVMGYNSDHYFYQNLWFHILNQGYRMTPVAELDGGYGENNKFPYGLYRTYYQVGEDMSMDNIVAAARQSRTFITSGPMVFATMDDKFQAGDDIPADGKARTLAIKVFASGAADDFLSYVIVFRSGKIFKLWDLREQQPRHFNEILNIQENERAWYVVKAYGKRAQQPENLDVLSVCGQIARDEFTTGLDSGAEICLTSPFYFWPNEKSKPQSLTPRVRLHVVDPATQAPVKNVAIELILDGKKLNSLFAKNGRAEFDMPLNALLEISAPGYPVIYRGLYLDYRPHRDMIETFANGDWLKQNNWQKILVPGQVPWEVFQFEKTKKVLSNVDWTIELKPNERDVMWEDYEALFR